MAKWYASLESANRPGHASAPASTRSDHSRHACECIREVGGAVIGWQLRLFSRASWGAPIAVTVAKRHAGADHRSSAPTARPKTIVSVLPEPNTETHLLALPPVWRHPGAPGPTLVATQASRDVATSSRCERLKGCSSCR